MGTAIFLVVGAAAFLAATWWQTRLAMDDRWMSSMGMPGNVARWFVRVTGVLGALTFLIAAGLHAFR